MITPDSQYELKIDFAKNSQAPRRVFDAMSGLIGSTDLLDGDLVSMFGLKVEGEFLLRDVYSGSVRASLARFLRMIDGDALKEGSWNKVLGRFLNAAREETIRRLEATPAIASYDQLADLQKALLISAEKTDLKSIPHYGPISLPRLVTIIRSFQMSVSPLISDDSVFYLHEGGSCHVPKTISIDPSLERAISIKESIPNIGDAILKIKKPDFIGDSMWEFQFGHHIVRAKIVHDSWLASFQRKMERVDPGDSLRVKLETITDYGYDGSVVSVSYRVLTVLNVIRGESGNQLSFGEKS